MDNKLLLVLGLGVLAIMTASKNVLNGLLDQDWIENIWATSFRDRTLADGTTNADPSKELIASLPTRESLQKWLEIEHKGPDGLYRRVYAQVRDVGPWYINDAYWNQPDGRPLAEATNVQAPRPLMQQHAERLLKQPKYQARIPKQRAGLDLSPAVWIKLGVPAARANAGNYSGLVRWRFAAEGWLI